MNHCKKCGNNIPDHATDCASAGFGDGCKKTLRSMTTSTVEEILNVIIELADASDDACLGTLSSNLMRELAQKALLALTTYGAEREAKGREALKAVRYMLEVWDEVLPEGWRENPNHVQSIFLQAVDSTPTPHHTE